jgi:hypothetical protein
LPLFVPTAAPFTFHWKTGLVPPCTGTAEKFTSVPAQILVALAVIVIVGVTCVTVVMVIILEAAVGLVTQPAFEVSSQDTWSPLFNHPLYVSLLVPAFTPLTFHWYAGVDPPLEATAVKLDIDPAHMEVDGVLILIPGVTSALTPSVIMLETALGIVTQLSLEVSSHTTWSPLLKLLVL